MGLITAVIEQPDLLYARQQMALSLGWHIILASLGMGFPVIILLTEWRAYRRNDPVLLTLAKRWSKAFSVLFAVGAVSGTILSFEFGILWPGFMGTYGDVFGLPFSMEAFAFFLEAIFLGIYLYGWKRLSPRQHLLAGIPVAISGMCSALFVVTVNAWMNQPRGFVLVDGKPTEVDPVRAMLNPASPPEVTHMILAAYIVSGAIVASVYAAAMLRGKRDRYHRLGFLIPFTFMALVAPVQIVVGDWAAHFLAERQPVKLAAAEGLYETTKGAGLHIGGIPIDGELRYYVEIPNALSLLAKHDPNATIEGLDTVAPEDRPPVGITHMAFQVMVGIGFLFLALGMWLAFTWWRRRDMPRPKLFLWLALASGPLAAVAMEAGWIVTEVGRQPWIVYRILRTEDAVTHAAGIRWGYYVLLFVYAALTVGIVFVLRRLAKSPLPDFSKMTMGAVASTASSPAGSTGSTDDVDLVPQTPTDDGTTEGRNR